MMAGCGGKKTGYMDGGMVSPRKAMAMGYMDGGMVGKKKKGYQKGGMVDSMTPQQAMTMGRDWQPRWLECVVSLCLLAACAR